MKNKRNDKVHLWRAGIASLFVLILVATPFITNLLPIEVVHVGGCPGRTIRLSLLGGDLERLFEAKKLAEERLQQSKEAQKKTPQLSVGCTFGETYKFYFF